ncbi:cysteine hydrolase [Frigoribacterium sp. CG_9.8]|uniref:cysteine hydrolase n=1 Tax=Frigoribacterium sp. CG_9.8 TaxID=2787733 RepID=UPI0018CA96F8|nr:cysteine hydrolase [Frigoribacterium sp. CG_9.8]MBG6108498.1 nicotinamidase-related amidase [Frigoribacterium sp. CG_9.8]
MSDSWLVVIDMQVVFADPSSAWCTPGYAAIEPTVVRLVTHFGKRVVFTRFIAPEHPTGAWVPYFQRWPFALVHHSDPLYDPMPAFASTDHTAISRTTFGKWSDELSTIIGPDGTVVLAGVSTDCCVLSTALAAADAGVRVIVAEDACAGQSVTEHQRAIDAMALYGPLIEIMTADVVLAR